MPVDISSALSLPWMTNVIAALAAAFSALSAWGSVIAISRSNAAQEAQVFLELSNRYLSEDMRRAIDTLVRFWEENIEQYPEIGDAWRRMRADMVDASRIEAASRTVGMYFMHIGQLYERKIIKRAFVRKLISFPGINVFYEICVPINIARNPRTLSLGYRTLLQTVLSNHEGGLYRSSQEFTSPPADTSPLPSA